MMKPQRNTSIFIALSLYFACLLPGQQLDAQKSPIDKTRATINVSEQARGLSNTERDSQAVTEQSAPAKPRLLIPGVDDASKQAYEEPESETEKKPKKLLPSDKNSMKLMQNFAKVAGFSNKDISHLTAKGTFKYGKEVKDFELTETAEGDRLLILSWKFMGREYREVVASPAYGNPWKTVSKKMLAADGSYSWKRIFVETTKNGSIDYRNQYGHTVISSGQPLRAKELNNEELKAISGNYAEVPIWHFRSTFLFLHPFLRSINQVMGYDYTGVEQLMGREAYTVKHDIDSRFLYFDREKFLLMQWSARGLLAGTHIQVNYRCKAFKRWDNVLFPSKIAILAKRAQLGIYEVSSLEINGTWDASQLEPPE